MTARLIPQSEGISIISLEKAITLIGRHPDCDGVLPDNQKISRRHCCIAQVENRLILRDLGSMNGVVVNGEQVSEIDLTDGDEITIGDEDFILEIQPKGPGAKKAPAKPAKKKGDPDAPTPDRPKPTPRHINTATSPSASHRRPLPIDISQEFPVPIADEEDSCMEYDEVEATGERRPNGRPPAPPGIKFTVQNEEDDSDSDDDSILKLDSGEIELRNYDDEDKKKKK